MRAMGGSWREEACGDGGVVEGGGDVLPEEAIFVFLRSMARRGSRGSTSIEQ